MTHHVVPDTVVDQVWLGALQRIMKEGGPDQARDRLGDEIDILVPQLTTAALLKANPAFAKLMYSSGYSAAKRNGYIMIRRAGMPPDFFWKFDHWSDDRGLSMLGKVMERIFGSIMKRHKAGLLEVTAVGVESSRFEISFASCAECSGLEATRPICFFHAGIFAGIIGAMLDRDLDAYEVECIGAGGGRCVFEVGDRADRGVAPRVEDYLDSPAVEVDVASYTQASLDEVASRDLGNMVDVGYYQLILSSSFLANLELVERACFETGADLGSAMAPVVSARFGDDATAAIGAFYEQLRYMRVEVSSDDTEVVVRAQDAPEAIGPLAQATLVPFLCGELQSLLSDLGGRKVSFESSAQEADGLLLRFVPQV